MKRVFELILLQLLVAPAFINAQVKENLTDTVSLSSKVDTLSEIVISSTLPAQTIKSNSVVTTVHGSALEKAGTANDVIAQIPGIKKDDDKFSVIGKGTPLIYVNGRKLQDITELGRMRSEDIASVELVTNPGAQYDATVKSVLIIKTVKKQGDGISGGFNSMLRQGYYTSLEEGINFNFRNRGFDIFGAFTYNYNQLYQRQKNYTTVNTSNAIWNQNSVIGIFPKASVYNTNLGFNYQVNDSQLFGVRYQYNNTSNNHSSWPTSQEILKDGIMQEKIVYNNRWNTADNPAHYINAYYQGTFNKFEINFNNDYYNSSTDKVQEITENGNYNGTINNRSRTGSEVFASKLVLDYKIGGTKIEGGYEYIYTDRKDRYSTNKDDLTATDNKIAQNLAAGFLSVTIPFGRTVLSAGLRYENTSYNYYQHNKKIDEQSRSYSDLFPTIDLTFPVKKAKFSLSYSAKTKRPLYSQLNSAVQYDDRFTYEQGNPLLQQETNHDITLQGIYRWVFFSSSYQYVKDAIASLIVPFEENSPVNLMTVDNYSHISKYSAIISFSPKVGKWSSRLMFSIMGQDFSIIHNGETRQMNNPLLFSSLYNSFSFKNGFILTADLTHRTSGDMDVVSLKPSWQINLGARKNIRNWDLQIQFTDIFKTARNSMYTYGTQMVLNKWNYSDSQAIKLTVRYKFNSTTNKYKGQSAGSSEINRL